jgi:hypothetical protein
MTAKCVMVLGTSSGAGKSWLTTALCRWYARQGLKVAPFKAQNMSNNARVVASHNGLGEVGSAQYFQALAAKAEPDVRMNPLLLKPEADTHSQVVLLGEVNNELTNTPWRDRSEKVWPQIAASLDALRAENDVVVIEGAGSPAEINLMALGRDTTKPESAWSRAIDRSTANLLGDFGSAGEYIGRRLGSKTMEEGGARRVTTGASTMFAVAQLFSEAVRIASEQMSEELEARSIPASVSFLLISSMRR